MKQKQITQEFLKFLNEKEIRKQFIKLMNKTWCDRYTMEQHCRFLAPKYYIAAIFWDDEDSDFSEEEWQEYHKEWNTRFKQLKSDNSWKK